MADDPYLASGRKVLSGKNDTSSSSSATGDPYLAGGRKALAQPSSSDADTKPPPTSTPYDVEHSWLGIPAIHNFAAGVTQGARDVVKSGLDLGAWVDKRVPVLSWLDEHNPLIGDPEKRAAEFDATRRAYEASPEGQSYTGGAGRLYGQIGTTAPLVGPVAEGVGAGVNALTAIAPKVPAIIPWLVRTAAEGATAGGTFGGLISGASDQPVGESIRQNTELGAVLGPAGSAVAKVVGLGGRVVKGGYNYVTGRSAAENVEQAMAEARARAGGGEAAPGPPPPPPSATPPATPQPGGAQVTPAGAVPAADRSAEIAGKTRALDQIISDRPNVNRSDFEEYVKGNLPTKPEGLGDANLAGIQRQIEADNPNYAAFRENAKANRVEHFEKRSGIPEQLDELEKDIAKWDKETLEPVWRNKQPVDASNVETLVRDRLNSPEAQIGPVEDALKEVEKRLYKRGTDTLQDDPQMLYGARRHISWMLSRAGRQTNPAYGTDDVMRELIGVRDEIDKAIEPGAQGFKAWVTEHATKMRDVDRMDVLQAMRQKLFAGGEITQGKLMAALKSLRTSMNSSGAHPAHSLELEDLEMLRDLNKDLLREGNKRLSMPVGSPTSRNDQVLIEHGLNLLSDAAGNIPGGRIAAQEALGRIARRNAARQRQLFEREFLTPEPNPLTQP
jgi:hypothetical protein